MAAKNEYAAVCRSSPVLDWEKVGIAWLCSILHTSTQGETPKDGNFTFHAILDQIRYNSRHPDFAAVWPVSHWPVWESRICHIQSQITREDTGATEQMTNIRNYNPEDGSYGKRMSRYVGDLNYRMINVKSELFDSPRPYQFLLMSADDNICMKH